MSTLKISLKICNKPNSLGQKFGKDGPNEDSLSIYGLEGIM